MNILFIFPVFPEESSNTNLTKDLVIEFLENKHNVYVTTIREKKYNLGTTLQNDNNINILRVETGNLFSANPIEKFIATVTMPIKLLSNIKKYWSEIDFDLIVTQTPYTANSNLINGLKSYYNCPAFLLLFDLFPQNAKDIGLIKNNILFNFLKYKEKRMLESFDYIGCMSKGNVKYIEKNYLFLDKKKIILSLLWGKDNHKYKNKQIIKKNIRDQYGYSKNDFLLIFGGNIGKPQKIDNIIKLALECKNDSLIKFIIIGKGTEKGRIIKMIKEKNINNILFMDYMKKDDYERLIIASDLGIVSLDERFTVPNFPSRSIDYLKLGLPILAALDKCSASDFGILIQDKLKCGLYSISGDTKEFKKNLYKIKNDHSLKSELSQNARNAFEKYYSIHNIYQRITELF